MISKFPIANAATAAAYHDRSFTQDGRAGADNYYLDELAVATWSGRGAQLLGLAGKQVERADFIGVLEGRVRNPATGEVQDLSQNSKGVARRAGLDFTVAPPKSVSILALVGKDERVVRAHQVANAAAMNWLEANASLVRIRDGDRIRAVQANNLTIATVVHETNRLNEPQLHSHNVIAAVVYDDQRGKWRSLTNDGLLRLRSQADIVYKRELASGLRLAGYELAFARNGVDFEIVGISPEQLQAFSGRSAEIAAALRARGIDPQDASYEARAAATLDSRDKKSELPRGVLHEAWRATAQAVDLSVDELVQSARDRSPRLSPDRDLDRAKALVASTWAIEHLAEREQTFRQVDLETTALKFERLTSIDAVRWAVAQHRANGFLVDRGATDGGDRLVTTSVALNEERQFLAAIGQGRGSRNVVMTEQTSFRAALSDYEARMSSDTGSTFRLSGEQRQAARAVLMHPDTYQGVQGAAGTGKTAALGFVKEVAEARGWNVLGIATTGSAAKELQASSGIKSQTVASFLSARSNAIALVERDISQLERELSAQRKSSRAVSAPAFERVRLAVPMQRSDGSTHVETGTYVFDHRRGLAFRNPSTFASLVGNFFLDAGASASERASRAEESGTLGRRIEANMLRMGAASSEFVGSRLLSYEQIGVSDAVAARTALYLLREGSNDPLAQRLRLKDAELANLKSHGNLEGRKTLIVMDESSLTGVRDARKITALATEIGARVVFQGDVKQHGSVSAGRGFEQAQQAGMHTSFLEETRRFDNATEQVKGAIQDVRVGKFATALNRLDTTEVAAVEFAERVADRYAENLRQLSERGINNPSVGVVALTNNDRKAINAAVHERLARDGVIGSDSFQKAHLDDPKLTTAERAHAGQLQAAGVDRIIFHRDNRRLGVKGGEALQVASYDVERNRVHVRDAFGQERTVQLGGKVPFRVARQESRGYAVGDRVELRAKLQFGRDVEPLANGTRGLLMHVNSETATVRWSDGRQTKLNNSQMQHIDYAYAHTTFKEQGATLHREIIAVSNTGARIINQKATYVAISRARDNTEIVTSDRATMLKNAGVDVEKSTALEPISLSTALSENRLHGAKPEIVRELKRTREQGWSF